MYSSLAKIHVSLKECFVLSDQHFKYLFGYVIYSTRIMISKGQRPFSSTRAVRVFWHFLSKIEYWVTLNRPLKSNQIRAVDPYS